MNFKLLDYLNFYEMMNKMMLLLVIISLSLVWAVG